MNAILANETLYWEQAQSRKENAHIHKDIMNSWELYKFNTDIYFVMH